MRCSFLTFITSLLSSLLYMLWCRAALGFGLFLWGLWASGNDADTVTVTMMVLSSGICCPYCSCAAGHHAQVWLGQSHKAQPALAIGEEGIFRVSLAGSKLRNYSICWECLRWESRFVMGWGVWKPTSVGTMEHLSAPVPFLLHWPKAFLDKGHTSTPEIKKCKNERQREICPSFPAFSLFTSQLFSPCSSPI